MPVSLPRGVRDYGPGEAIFLKRILESVELTFRSFGFYPIETPAIETMEVLSAKAYGNESAKELYVLDGGEGGLRYDLTVPLARYVASNKELQMPFKRYQIAASWRRDEPQRMRSREFIQADVDIVGCAEQLAESESVAAVAAALDKLGIEYIIMLNSRVRLNYILALAGVPKEKHTAAIRGLDKIAKIGRDGVIKEMNEHGIDAKASERLLGMVEGNGEEGDVLAKLASSLPEAKSEIERLNVLIETIKYYGIKGKIMVDLSLARGLDYYTGIVWEFIAYEDGRRLPTIASGGRYDKLIGIYLKRDVPAVGTSIGISRIFEMLKHKEDSRTYADVYLACIGKDAMKYAVESAMRLRTDGLRVDMEVGLRGISKQLEHASSLGIRHVVIVGKQEMVVGKVKLRNMESGEEKILDIGEVKEEMSV